MQFESTLAESLTRLPQYLLRLHFALTVDDTVIGISAQPNAREMALHPPVDSLVQEAHDPSLRSAPIARDSLSLYFHGRLQPSFDVQYRRTHGTLQCFRTARIRNS